VRIAKSADYAGGAWRGGWLGSTPFLFAFGLLSSAGLGAINVLDWLAVLGGAAQHAWPSSNASKPAALVALNTRQTVQPAPNVPLANTLDQRLGAAQQKQNSNHQKTVSSSKNKTNSTKNNVF